MKFGLEGEQYYGTDDEQYQQKNKFALGGSLLVTRGDDKFLLRGLDVCGHALDVVIDAVEHGALVDDHVLEVPEQIRQLDDALRDVLDFALALQDYGVIAVQ